MTLLAAGKKVAGVSLVRTIAHGPAYPGLDHVGERLGRGLAEFLSGVMAAPVSVAAATICLREQAPVEGIALRHIRLSPLKCGGRIETRPCPASRNREVAPRAGLECIIIDAQHLGILSNDSGLTAFPIGDSR